MTQDGLYLPQINEVWHSDARFRELEYRYLDALGALAAQHELRVIADRIKDGDDDLGGAISWFARSIEGENVEDPNEHFMQAAEDPAPYGKRKKLPPPDAPEATG